MKKKGMGSHQSGAMVNDTWLTPRHIIDALGPFDLDPCAAPDTILWPTARQHICLPNDGLSVPWNGFVWCNPPYGRSAEQWLDRMDKHGHGIALTFARTETASFFKTVWRARNASALLFLEGRLHFHFPDGRRADANSGAPSVLIAYGRSAGEVLAGSGLRGALIAAWQAM
jgi:hypothetical protein